jgi:hypothetical protein
MASKCVLGESERFIYYGLRSFQIQIYGDKAYRMQRFIVLNILYIFLNIHNN